MTNATIRVQSPGEGQRLFRRKFMLQVLEGPDKGEQLITAGETTTVGSADWNDMVLNDPSVSRHHLRIKITPDGFALTDLDSTNGTTAGNLELRQALILGPLDLRLGDTKLRFTPLSEEEEVPLPSVDHFGEVIGRSAAMRELFRKLERVAEQDSGVLLEGETGTGKEIVARALHTHGPRVDKPFVVVDFAAIPEALHERELFGAATADQPGAFEAADGGTLLLDGVELLSDDLQQTLASVLERREAHRIGDTVGRPFDVRVISSSTSDLMRAVNQGSFRADLFYRLGVVHFTLPPLRERIEDIEPLIEALWPEIGEGDPPAISQEVLQKLRAHPWPGNVRELRNVIERMVTLTDGSESEIVEELRLEAPDQPLALEDLDSLTFREAKATLLEHFEQRYLTELLRRTGHNVTQASRESGVDRVHLYRLIKKYQLKRP
ncbi:MAG: sigma 54-dependent Fis family transcriptional regulator [Myxococcales bacterium]|nr:sigma 54-dependent Fis family transcriptional regulator [Myxococcales bacterium]